MRDQVELAASIQRAMKNKKLSPQELGKKLGVNQVMVTKIICGDVVPSSHLEKQMIHILEIDPNRVKHLVGKQKNRANKAMERESEGGKRHNTGVHPALCGQLSGSHVR
jgi:ribosome-binding protein aMBF1 (putative translation factor)